MFQLRIISFGVLISIQCLHSTSTRKQCWDSLYPFLRFEKFWIILNPEHCPVHFKTYKFNVSTISFFVPNCLQSLYSSSFFSAVLQQVDLSSTKGDHTFIFSGKLSIE